VENWLTSTLFFWLRGARASHWPWNASAPPTPTGPTMSGELPPAISVASASRAPWYATTSSCSLMLGWLELKLSTAAFSTLTWSGASPVPRQQYQRIVTGAPAAALADAAAGVSVAGAALGASALA